MADSKIDFSFENLHFSCEGDNAWVERQLNNVLSRIPALLSVHKKGENIVEEVIDVNEEDVNEVSAEATRDAKKVAKAPREKKAKAVKVAGKKAIKVKIEKEPLTKSVRTAKTPKSIEIKDPQPAKAPKVKVVKIAKSVEGEVAKPARKTKIAKAHKAKAAKKKVAKASTEAGQTDSPLFQYLADKKVTTNQVRKFLATAVFLARNNGVSKLSTSMISKALKSYKIEKLQNASDCLNKNEKKGYCIKDGKEFTITENGYLSVE